MLQILSQEYNHNTKKISIGFIFHISHLQKNFPYKISHTYVIFQEQTSYSVNFEHLFKSDISEMSEVTFPICQKTQKEREWFD